MKSLLLAGATGLVGQHVLALALADARVARVVAPTRRALAAHLRLENPLIDFGRLPEDAAWWRVDGVVCALGTTIRAAGSRAAFRTVDYDYPLAIARLARRHGATAYALNSSMGASAASGNFYLRTKGEVEQAIAGCGYPSLTLVRPGLLGGTRTESRPGEFAGLVALRIFGPLLPRRWRISPAPRVAAALLEAALNAQPGTHTIESAALAAQ